MAERRIRREIFHGASENVSRGLYFGEYSEPQVAEVMKDPHGFLERNLNRHQLGTHWGSGWTAQEYASGDWAGGYHAGGEVYGEAPM